MLTLEITIVSEGRSIFDRVKCVIVPMDSDKEFQCFNIPSGPLDLGHICDVLLETDNNPLNPWIYGTVEDMQLIAQNFFSHPDLETKILVALGSSNSSERYYPSMKKDGIIKRFPWGYGPPQKDIDMSAWYIRTRNRSHS